MRKFKFLMCLLCSCSQFSNDSKLKRTMADTSVHYYKDFNLLTFVGIDEIESEIQSYPHVEMKEINDTTTQLRISLDDRRIHTEQYVKRNGYFIKEEIGKNGERKELRRVIINNQKLFYFTFLFDASIELPQNKDLELSTYSVFDGSTRSSYTLLPQYQDEYSPSLNLKNFELHISKEHLYNESKASFLWRHDTLVINSEGRIYDTLDPDGDIIKSSSCYDLKGLSVIWYFYWGHFLKIDC